MKDLQFLGFIGKSSKDVFYNGVNYSGVSVRFYINKKDDSQVVVTLETVAEVIVSTQIYLMEFNMLTDAYEDDALASYFYRHFNCMC